MTRAWKLRQLSLIYRFVLQRQSSTLPQISMETLNNRTDVVNNCPPVGHCPHSVCHGGVGGRLLTCCTVYGSLHWMLRYKYITALHLNRWLNNSTVWWNIWPTCMGNLYMHMCQNTLWPVVSEWSNALDLFLSLNNVKAKTWKETGLNGGSLTVVSNFVVDWQ